MRLMLTRVLALILLGLSVGCGRAMPPRPPEDFAPVAVSSLQAARIGTAVQISWRAPAKNQLGEELTEIAGYRILRRPYSDKPDGVVFQEIGVVSDSHLNVLAEKRAEARAAGLSGRRVKLPNSLVTFSFTDKNPIEPAEYQVVPFQLAGQVGLVEQVIVAKAGALEVLQIQK